MGGCGPSSTRPLRSTSCRPPSSSWSPTRRWARSSFVSEKTAMDFGLFFLMQRDEQWSESAVYDSDVQQMLAAESLGYQSVWIAEHHFNDYGLCPAPQVLAAYVAARTTTLRLGMGVSLLPLHHPVDLAEALAGLAGVRGGRLAFWSGRGRDLRAVPTLPAP